MILMKLASLTFLLLVSISASSKPTHDLTRDEAIKLAEAAILRNGCLDLAPLKRRVSSMTGRELVDHELVCRAIYARKGNVDGKEAWIVGFYLTFQCLECPIGLRDRLILMKKDGTNLRLENREKRIKRIKSLPIESIN